MFSVFCRLKTVSLVVKHSQSAEALVKSYESKLYEEDAMNSDVKSIESVISTLKVKPRRILHFRNTGDVIGSFWVTGPPSVYSNGGRRSTRSRRCSTTWRTSCRKHESSATACSRRTTSATSTSTGTKRRPISWVRDGRTFTLRLTAGSS